MSEFSQRPSKDEISRLVTKYRKVAPVLLQPEWKGDVPRAALAEGLEHYTDPMNKEALWHLLRRTLVGPKKSDLKAFEGFSLQESVSKLLVTDAIEPPVNDYNSLEDGIEDPQVPFGETWIHAVHGGDYEGQRILSLKAWMVRNMIHQPLTISERITLFWHNLLVTESWAVFFAKLSYRHLEMLRRNSLGNFKTMIRELTLDPAMLLYLNGTFNEKTAPDENYSRELQELFCIGKGPNAQFTEGDVQAAAKILTGWQIDWAKWDQEGDMTTMFNPYNHDTTDKVFSDFYGGRVIAGRSGNAGAQELDDLLEMIFDNAETARYICRRLYNFFVYHEIDEQAEAQVIEPLAQLFRESNYEIKPVLEKLLSSAHFFAEANRGSMIKSPVDFVLGLWKTLGMSGVDLDDLLANHKQHISILWQMGNIGMELGDPPNVSGWPAYYQAPSFDKYWITTDTISNRAIVSDSMIFWGFWIQEGVQIPVDLVAFVQQLDEPAMADAMLRESCFLLLGISPSDETLANLKTILLSGQANDDYWYSAWVQLMANPDDPGYRLIVENRLKATFQTLLQLGEVHLM